ncbi:MAG: hypothetical protein PVH26_03500, partial [Desulfosarcina sp.]
MLKKHYIFYDWWCLRQVQTPAAYTIRAAEMSKVFYKIDSGLKRPAVSLRVIFGTSGGCDDHGLFGDASFRVPGLPGGWNDDDRLRYHCNESVAGFFSA